MSYPSPAHALAAIAKELGAEGLQFDETGLARINIGKNVVVAFGQGVRSDCLDFLAEIPLKIDQLSKETACQLLLENFRTGGPGLPSFSINPSDGSVLLTNSLPVHRLSIEEIMDSFRRFTAVVVHFNGEGLHQLREGSTLDDATIN